MSALAVRSFGFEGNTVRVLDQEGEPWFVAQDVCSCLEIANTSQAVVTLDDDEKGICESDTLGGAQQVLIVSESGMYALIFKSRKPAAVRFRKWVTSEVLPTLRKTGRYILDPANDDSDTLGLADPERREQMRLGLMLVREARALYGRQRARMMWDLAGLPCPDGEPPPGLTLARADPAVERWVRDRCAVDEGFVTESTELFEDYAAWCGDNDLPPLSQVKFGRQLTVLGFVAHKSGRVQRIGLRLKD